jgi:hypothetical protein
MCLINADAGDNGRQVLGQEELEVIARIPDLDPAQPHTLIPCVLQVCDTVTEAERGDSTLSAVPLAAVEDASEVAGRQSAVPDGEVRPVMERVPARRVGAAPACQESDQVIPVHGGDGIRAATRAT